MKINKLLPQGYCGGVKHALKMALEALDNPKYPKPIYLLGAVIHNQQVIQSLEKKGAILLEEKGKSKKELLQKVSSGTILISAHGVAPEIYNILQEKKLNFIDTTCPNVTSIQNKIKHYLNKNYACIYIGTKGHPECEGILGISKNIIFIDKLEDIQNLAIDLPKLYVTNQTTLSLFETEEIYKSILKRYPEAILDNKICTATTVRQEAVIHQPKVDLCIVVGDKSSSNTKKLVLAGTSASIKTIQVEHLEDLKKIDLKGINHISVTSGASTPDEITNSIIEYLKRVD
ncbi:MAG: 4-hydroxy-3-methylbut-2-enyl diphosphate reductase [Anaeroplasmataceae bacterium]|nr:4-hydroxy-3-methylbut-2-enyl diphosphate reductase [Anaeroplasmataceae bacterium]